MRDHIMIIYQIIILICIYIYVCVWEREREREHCSFPIPSTLKGQNDKVKKQSYAADTETYGHSTAALLACNVGCYSSTIWSDSLGVF